MYSNVKDSKFVKFIRFYVPVMFRDALQTMFIKSKQKLLQCVPFVLFQDPGQQIKQICWKECSLFSLHPLLIYYVCLNNTGNFHLYFYVHN